MTKSTIPFVLMVADRACEQVNLLMKVHGGITGISNNPNARQGFFLTAPELSIFANYSRTNYILREYKLMSISWQSET